MLFSPLAWALFALTFIVTVPGALATSSPKKAHRKKASATRVTIETYPALEDEEIVTPRSAPSLGMEAPLYVPAPPKPAPVKYVVVPAEKRAQILKRLQLCQKLFELTGRAYDYREMTTSELEKEAATASGKPKKNVTLRQDENGVFKVVEPVTPTPPSLAAAPAPDPEVLEAVKDPILDAEVEL